MVCKVTITSTLDSKTKIVIETSSSIDATKAVEEAVAAMVLAINTGKK